MIETRSQDLAHNAYLLSSDFGFKKVVATGDPYTIQSALQNLLHRIGADVAMLVSLENQLLADTAHPANKGPFFRKDIISQAERSGTTMTIVEIDNLPHQMIIVPVLAPQPIAWLCVSFKIGENLVSELNRLTQSYISIVQFQHRSNFAMIASSLPSNDRPYLLPELNFKQLQSNKLFSLQLGSTRYLNSISLLYDSSTLKVIAILQKSLDLEMIPYYRLQWVLLGIALLSLTLALLGSLFLARRVSQPLKKLVIGTRAIGNGQYDYRIKINQQDEFGELGVAFNEMAERRQIHESLRLAKESAESASRAKSEFLANMSHELRTPLNSILGYAQLLKKNEITPNKQSNALNTIEQSGQHLLALIDDLLDLSKIEAGKFELQEAKFNLREMLQSIIDIMQERAYAKNLGLVTNIDREIPTWVLGDAKRLRQILTNLLDNAIKYTPNGEISMYVKNVNNKIRFLVRDTGIGIHANQLGFIFDSFHQAYNGKQYVQGSGLGLSICDRLIRLMGSEIKVSSVADEGSQFWFDLDIKSFDERTETVFTKNHEFDDVEGRGKRIVIADADKDNCQLLSDFLSPMGFDIRVTTRGEQCMNEVIEWHPHIMIIDMQLPIASEVSICQRVRALSNIEQPFLIAISASAFDHQRKRYLQAGADLFIAKPIDMQKLLNALYERCNLKPVVKKVIKGDSNDSTNDHQILPEKHYLDGLIAATDRGDIQAIKELVTDIENAGTGETTFTNQIKALAQDFRIKQIKALLRQNAGHEKPFLNRNCGE